MRFGVAVLRVLAESDSFCPKCGHNRDVSSVSSVDEDNGWKSCQMCGADWIERTAAGVKALEPVAWIDPAYIKDGKVHGLVCLGDTPWPGAVALYTADVEKEHE